MTTQVAIAITGSKAGAEMTPTEIAKKAADIVDAVYSEKASRNEADSGIDPEAADFFANPESEPGFIPDGIIKQSKPSDGEGFSDFDTN
tara:strand:- start:18086 stop:18352 length:267 start_codon:yes stop_codon:yes gene_type:complete